MARTGKRLAKAHEGIDRERSYSLDDAIAAIKGCASAKFDETVELALNLNVDPRHADQMCAAWWGCPTARAGRCGWPCSPATPGPRRSAEAGADIVGAEDLAERIRAGEIEFDRCIATPT